MLNRLPPTTLNKPAPTPGSRPVPTPTPTPPKPPPTPPPRPPRPAAAPASPPATPTPAIGTDTNVPEVADTEANDDTTVVGPYIEPVDVTIDVGTVGIPPSPTLGTEGLIVSSVVPWPAGAGAGGIVTS